MEGRDHDRPRHLLGLNPADDLRRRAVAELLSLDDDGLFAVLKDALRERAQQPLSVSTGTTDSSAGADPHPPTAPAEAPKQPPRRSLDRGGRRGGNQHPPSLPTAVRTRAPSSGRGTVPLTATSTGGQGRRGQQTTGTAVVAGPGTRRVGPVPGRPRAVIIPSRPPLIIRALRGIAYWAAVAIGSAWTALFLLGLILVAALHLS